MALRTQSVFPGRLVWVEFDSRVLRGNPWNDPTQRRFPVWLPEGYDLPGNVQRYPVLYGLAGYFGSGPSQVNWQPFNETVPERVARLIHSGAMGPVILVFPDCFTRLGGNQYVNSSALGAYGDYLSQEVVPFIDATFRTLAKRDHRGVFGKSSGGYGALFQAIFAPDCWGGVVSHAGDAGFDLVYRGDWPNTLDMLARFRPDVAEKNFKQRAHARKALTQGLDDGRVASFLAAVCRLDRPSSAETHALMNLGMAATYDPDPAAPNGFRLPFHLETGALLSERWARWQACDPVYAAPRHAAILRQLKCLFLDCGWRDQYHLHYGVRQLSAALTRARVPHVHEEFDGTHSGIDFRLDRSLPHLYAALKP
ncbi:alpha/beta hydrolase-fold protein [Ferrovum sp.]|uniref:alpha/beta hydrolase n=1 Tax=Ferrovum sp. TaxID=2609467 RepID=UPI00260E32AA|nr:alpha/beta hydrolase-fold protein [Ferrovum sp.]